MKVLAIEPDTHRDYCSSQLLYEYLAGRGCQVGIISPRHMCTSKGYMGAPAYEEFNGVKSFRIYDDLPHMWSNANSMAKEVQQLVRSFDPDILYIHHEGGYPLFDIAIAAKPSVKKVVFIEMPSHQSITGAQSRGADMLFSCERPDRYKEEELTKMYNMPILQVNWSTGVPDAEKYHIAPELKKNQAVFAGTFQWPYKRHDLFIQTVPLLFKNTPLKKLIVVSNTCLQLNQVKEGLRGLPIEYIERMNRWEWLKLLSESYFGYTSLVERMPGVFPMESWATKTVAFVPGIENMIDDVNCVKTIEGINKIYNNVDYYNKITDAGFVNWKNNESAEAVGERYYRAFRGIVDGKTKEIWEELRWKKV